MFLFIILVIVALVLCYLYLVWNFQYWNDRGVPSAKAYPLLGSFPKSTLQTLNVCYELDNIYKEYRGKTPYVGVFSGRKPQLLILDAAFAKDILVKDFKNFHDNEFASLINKEVDPLFSRNPFMLTGEEWKDKRAEITPAFTNNRLKAMYPIIDDVCQKMTQYLRREIINENADGLDAKELAAKFTANVVASCIYGIDSKEFTVEKSAIREMGSTIFAPNFIAVMYFIFSEIFPVLRKIYKMPIVSKRVESFFEQLMGDAIKMRKEQQIDRDDYLGYLLQLKKKKNLSDIEVVAHTMTFFLDGFETSSIVIAHILYHLASNKQIQERLRKELNENVGKDGRIDMDRLGDFEYLDQVFNETLRLNNPGAFFSRICTIPTVLTDYKDKTLQIEKGMTVKIPLHAIHKDAEHYHNPEIFDPERFSKENGGTKVYKDKGAFLGFSDGPRICLGMRFGTIQTKAAVAEVIRNFEVTVNSKTKEPLVMDPKGFLMLPIGGLWINFKAL